MMYMRAGGRHSKTHVHVDPICYVPEVLESHCWKTFHQSVQSPESSSDGKGVRTQILLLYSEVAEVRHFTCCVQQAVVCVTMR